MSSSYLSAFIEAASVQLASDPSGSHAIRFLDEDGVRLLTIFVDTATIERLSAALDKYSSSSTAAAA